MTVPYDATARGGNRYEPLGRRIGIRRPDILHENECDCQECDTYRAANGYRALFWKSMDVENGLLYPDSPPRPAVGWDVVLNRYFYVAAPQLVKSYDAKPPQAIESDGMLDLFSRTERD